MCKHLKMLFLSIFSKYYSRSYTITCMSILLTNYFFLKQSYIHHNRFVVCTSSLLIATKIIDMPPRLKLRRICLAYHNVLKKVKKNKHIRPLMDEKLMEEYKKIVCLAESKVLKTINY